jgi:hypothetical protein
MPSTNDIKLFFDDISHFLCKNAEYKINNNTVSHHVVIFELIIFIELTDCTEFGIIKSKQKVPFPSFPSLKKRTAFCLNL